MERDGVHDRRKTVTEIVLMECMGEGGGVCELLGDIARIFPRQTSAVKGKTVAGTLSPKSLTRQRVALAVFAV